MTGTKGNWPCPNDPPEIRGCFIQPCKGTPQPGSQCAWTEACLEEDPGKLIRSETPSNKTFQQQQETEELLTPEPGVGTTRATCPGGNDFRCCAVLKPE